MSQADWIVAFTKAQAEFPPIGKDTSVTIKSDKGNYSYRYAALPDILDAIAPGLDTNGLALAQSVSGDGNVIAVETRIYHKAGWVEVFGPLALKVAGDAKAAGSAITYARRYALCAALGIAPDEDDDGARASQRQEEPKEMTPWEWVWNESAIFKAWSKDERLEASAIAMTYLAYADEPKDMTEAKSILEHMRGQYETRTDTLPLEEK